MYIPVNKDRKIPLIRENAAVCQINDIVQHQICLYINIILTDGKTTLLIYYT